jgi:hypothetical protein
MEKTLMAMIDQLTGQQRQQLDEPRKEITRRRNAKIHAVVAVIASIMLSVATTRAETPAEYSLQFEVITSATTSTDSFMTLRSHHGGLVTEYHVQGDGIVGKPAINFPVGETWPGKIVHINGLGDWVQLYDAYKTDCSSQKEHMCNFKVLSQSDAIAK